MKTNRAAVFEETYENYVEQIRRIDFLGKAEILGIDREAESLIIPLYDKTYLISAAGLSKRGGGSISPAVQVMICKYILMAPAAIQAGSDSFVTFREFRESGPLMSYFTTNTNKTLEATFSGSMDLLKERAERIGGERLLSEVYDLSFIFYAFPKIPVVVNFNDRDELFPANCSILFRSTAELYLDMECLAMTGTLLAGKLINPEAGG